jgi:hypothetical protein
MKHELEVRNFVVSGAIASATWGAVRMTKPNRHITTAIVLVIAWLLYHINFSNPTCGQHVCNGAFLDDDGFGFRKNFLSQSEFGAIQDEFVRGRTPGKMYPNNTTFVSDSPFVRLLIDKVSEAYGKEMHLDYAFLRYYDGKALNPFENMHFDSLHYNHDVVQVRALLNVYDRSKGHFSYESRCCDRGQVTLKTEENTLTLIQANKLKHKYKYQSGERLVFVVDMVTSKHRGVYGSVWAAWDYIWDRLQKLATTS